MARPTSLVLAGGLGLGAYQAGAVAALERSGALDVRAVAGSSIGAMNGAVYAAAPDGEREAQLRRFWKGLETEAVSAEWVDPLGLAAAGPLRHLRNWGNVLASHTMGVNRLCRPRLPGMGKTGIPSLYDSAEGRASLSALIDFERLNAGPVRYCAGTTDIETGETVIFDTAAEGEITVEHLLASGALLPGFEPVRIGERWLGDGGYSANAPLEVFLSSERGESAAPLCIVIDLFSPDAPVPDRLEGAIERANDLKYACQTVARLEGLRRERALEAQLGNGDGAEVVYLSYRAPREEASAEKAWDFSPRTIADRWRTGEADAEAALAVIAGLPAESAPGMRIHRIRRT